MEDHIIVKAGLFLGHTGMEVIPISPKSEFGHVYSFLSVPINYCMFG